MQKSKYCNKCPCSHTHLRNKISQMWLKSPVDPSSRYSSPLPEPHLNCSPEFGICFFHSFLYTSGSQWVGILPSSRGIWQCLLTFLVIIRGWGCFPKDSGKHPTCTGYSLATNNYPIQCQLCQVEKSCLRILSYVSINKAGYCFACF